MLKKDETYVSWWGLEWKSKVVSHDGKVERGPLIY